MAKLRGLPLQSKRQSRPRLGSAQQGRMAEPSQAREQSRGCGRSLSRNSLNSISHLGEWC